MMHVIILSGGSGIRLWPLSNRVRSKQFLKLFRDTKGEPCSGIQRVYRQLREAGVAADISVSTGADQAGMVRSQLGEEVAVITEPERRDTFPAILLASLNLALTRKCGGDDVVAVVPADTFADTEYYRCLSKLERAVCEKTADILLMGVEPTYPSAKYGYMIMEEGAEPRRVSRFIEKPGEKAAAELIAQGAVWNGGIFAFRLEYMLELAERYLPVSSYDEALARYGQLKKTSFDYEVLEHSGSVAAVTYRGPWKDLGTWNTVTEQMDGPSMGNVTLADTCRNTHVLNELSIPVMAMGLKDLVIAASADGILVADKAESSYIKPLVDGIRQRPMQEERAWGEYRVLDMVSFQDGTKSLTKQICIRAGQAISCQRHKMRDEIWMVADGTGELLLDGKLLAVERGSTVKIPAGAWHRLRAETDLHLIEVQIGGELTEEDIERCEQIP